MLRGGAFGKRWVITEYADLLVISSSLFLALRSDSLASCRSCFSWWASFALRRIDTWVTHSRFEPFEVDTVLGTPKHKFSWKWKNGCSDQQKIETFTGTKSNSYPACIPTECHILSKGTADGFERGHQHISSCERKIWDVFYDAFTYGVLNNTS